jgi:SAM-dependent methyltransferase
MNKINLTEKEFWNTYWESKRPVQICENYSFHEIFRSIITQLPDSSSAIEIGGFPGYFSIFLKKYLKMDVSLIDYHYNEVFFNNALAINGLTGKDVNVINDDLFLFSSEKKFNLVYSCGLIEHFTDMKKILLEHKKFVKPGGIIFIVVPNFLGINGTIQKYFDNKNFKAHNLNAMRINNIRELLQSIGLIEIESNYYSSSQVWVEELNKRGLFINLVIRFMNKVFMPSVSFLFGKRNKVISNSVYWIFKSV